MTVAEAQPFPQIKDHVQAGYFPLVTAEGAAAICTDEKDYKVAAIAANMLADDIERVTGQRPAQNGEGKSMILAGTLGKSRMIAQATKGPKARFLPVAEALSEEGVLIESDRDAEIPLWMEALTPVHHFSKAPADNVFCQY